MLRDGGVDSQRFARRAFLGLALFYFGSIVVMCDVYDRHVDNVLSTLSFEVVCMLLAFLVVVRYREHTLVVLLATLVVLETGYCLSANFSPAGAEIAPKERPLYVGPHVASFPAPRVGQPRLTDPRDLNNESSSEAYVLKKFHINDYNPVRSRRLDALIGKGFGGWLQAGARIVALPRGALPNDFAQFAALAKPVQHQIVRHSANGATYSVDLSEEALLVFNELYFPGWTSTVDGTSAELITVAGGLRGVMAPRGAHVIEMRFRPSGFSIGLAVSIGSLLVLLGWVALAAWSAKKRRHVAAASAGPELLVFDVCDADVSPS